MKAQARFRTLPIVVALILGLGGLSYLSSQSTAVQQAPTGFTTPTGCPTTNLPAGVGPCSGNGYPMINGESFIADQQVFEEEEDVTKGLGPVYNDKSCANCHQDPVTGGSSQIAELRVGHNDLAGNFVNPTITINDGQTTVPNRSLVNDRAICPQAQERVPLGESIRTLRMSLSTLGDGFIEAIDDNTLIAISLNQMAQTGGRVHGEVIEVPVLEAPGHTRVGRFGWKDQHASLLSFASDAYLNEMGVSNSLNPTDTTSVCKTTSDPEDQPDGIGMADIDHFASFIRGTNAPPRDTLLAATADAQAGAKLFSAIGCSICHVTAVTTAPVGAQINGGALVVPTALGGMTIHPYSDFLLHDVGTGDGIVQNGPADTANKMRTPPLWGLRVRSRLMHDGASLTRNEAILRHAGEAGFVVNNYRGLSKNQKLQLLTFLDSL